MAVYLFESVKHRVRSVSGPHSLTLLLSHGRALALLALFVSLPTVTSKAWRGGAWRACVCPSACALVRFFLPACVCVQEQSSS